MRNLKLECAPMQGVTDYVFRRVQSEHFGSADRYYTPFISPTANHILTPRMMQELAPEHNEGLNVIPQLIGHNAEDFLWAANELKAMGYAEVNFNLGCPSGTVVSKKKGSGLLNEKDMLREFFDEVFEKTPVSISVKTRIGRQNTDEFAEILELYNSYPIKELIVHPRLQIQQYKGTPCMSAWNEAEGSSRAPLCYNGDIFNKAAAMRFADAYPEVSCLMLGRGLASNPKLIAECRGEHAVKSEELEDFHEHLFRACQKRIGQEKPLLLHMKEAWFYLGCCFENSGKQIKELRKSQHIPDYLSAVQKIFSQCPVKENAGFIPD